MKRTITTTLAAATAAVALAACGGGGGSTGDADADTGGGGAEAVTVEATEFAFDPGDFSLPADTAVDITLANKGVVEHDITVDELDLEIFATGGETTTETVTLPAGTYTFYCSVPGHRTGGMEGTLTVS